MLSGNTAGAPAQALALAQEYFDEWFPLATASQKGFMFYQSQEEFRHAAFTLHQACEQLYHCVLLVCTFHTPHAHNLGFLRIQAERIDFRLVHAWPQDTRVERARFEKLKAAYVKARYSPRYSITADELAWLGSHVEGLGRTVHAVCTERIASLKTSG